jgi:hypothetical protein
VVRQRYSLKQLLGISKRGLDEFLQRRRVFNFWLDQVFLDYPDFEERRLRLISRVNECLSFFFCSDEEVHDAYLGGNTITEGIDKDELVRASTGGISLGRFLYDKTYYNFDIKAEADGEGYAMLTFKLPEYRELSIVGSGDFWTEYTYKHPTTGENFCPDEDRRFEMEDVLGRDLELQGSSLDFQLSVEGTIMRTRS